MARLTLEIASNGVTGLVALSVTSVHVFHLATEQLRYSAIDVLRPASTEDNEPIEEIAITVTGRNVRSTNRFPRV